MRSVLKAELSFKQQSVVIQFVLRRHLHHLHHPATQVLIFITESSSSPSSSSMSVLPLRVRVLRRVWRLKRFLVVVVSPFLLLPLALSTSEAACAYVISLMALFWCTEVLPLAVTALLPVILFPLLGIMESKDVCMQYLRDTNMLFVGGLMVAVAVEHWNLHKRIALKVLLVVGVRPAMLMLGFMGVTAFLSMWISNTATTAMMVPIVQAVLEQLHRRQDPGEQSSVQVFHVGVPLPGQTGNGAQSEVGGAAETVYQEANGQVGGVAETVYQKGNGQVGGVAEAVYQEVNGQVGGVAEAVYQEVNGQVGGVAEAVYQEVNGQEALKPPPQDKPPSRGVVCPMEEEEAASFGEERKRQSKGLLLCVSYAASIGGIATLTGTGPNLVLVGQMSQLFPQNGDVINFASWFAFAFPAMVLMLALAWFWLQFVFIGCNLRRTWGCGAGPTAEERAAYEVIEDEHRRLGRMSYGEVNILLLFVLMVALWFTRDPRFMDGWATRLFNAKGEFVTDATVSLLVALMLFVLPSEPPRYLCCWGRSSDAGPAPPLLTWQVTQKKMPWNIVLLLGGGFALAKGSEESGLSRWLGEQMAPLHSIPPWAVVVVLCLLIATFTECASNVATATLFLPIVASMSQSIGLNPLYVMIPCTLSASFAFMLPVATPPNAIVFSAGHLRVSDMVKTGVVMNVIGILCISLAINSWGRLLFSLDSFPFWANVTTSV
ncbi:Na(+)/citrate cotransporter-like isoform X2 [Nerophis ophidion]|uniref:Na(+)/citrate cotransporter-like isoform X2 n=1 Tax=Nerophis ophidion TaxID=159077 RepID=UPI002ADF9B67|nr:Na(+)/citrate cotransporter-like isoform X2 [Nerophis ophidion]